MKNVGRERVRKGSVRALKQCESEGEGRVSKFTWAYIRAVGTGDGVLIGSGKERDNDVCLVICIVAVCGDV